MRVFAILSGKPGSEIISELELRGATILYNFSLIDAIGCLRIFGIVVVCA
jgi:hypothetical protein